MVRTGNKKEFQHFCNKFQTCLSCGIENAFYIKPDNKGLMVEKVLIKMPLTKCDSAAKNVFIKS